MKEVEMYKVTILFKNGEERVLEMTSDTLDEIFDIMFGRRANRTVVNDGHFVLRVTEIAYFDYEEVKEGSKELDLYNW